MTMATLNFTIKAKRSFLFCVLNKWAFGLFKVKIHKESKYMYIAFNKVGWIE